MENHRPQPLTWLPCPSPSTRSSPPSSPLAAPGAGDEDEVEYELSDDHLTARECHERAVQELLQRRRAYAMAVPTNDFVVRACLRRLGKPITLFREKEMERRDRFRVLMVRLEADGHFDRLLRTQEDDQGGSTDDGEDAEQIQYPFFTEGTQEMLQALVDIALYSLPRAKARVEKAKRRLANPPWRNIVTSPCSCERPMSPPRQAQPPRLAAATQTWRPQRTSIRRHAVPPGLGCSLGYAAIADAICGLRPSRRRTEGRKENRGNHVYCFQDSSAFIFSTIRGSYHCTMKQALVEDVRRMYMQPVERNKRSDEGLLMDSAGRMPAVQGGQSEEEMGMREKMPINLRSNERLQFHAAGKRPAGQGGDSEEEMDMRSNQRSDGGVQVHAAGSLVVGILRESMRPSHQQEILNYDEENRPQKQENQRQKQENQLQKVFMPKKHSRKSRMAVRKIAMDKVKKSNMEKPPMDKPPVEDKAAAYLALWAKEKESEPESESSSDWNAYQAGLRRDSWNEFFAAGGHYGTYETPTDIPSMRFTDCVDDSAGPRETLQIFSVKVVGVKEGVGWPLYVYGKLAVRDTVDRKRNYIFDRQRDNYQTVTKEDPYLTLTGPLRAAVLSVRHSYIEAELKIKDNSSDSDDRDFSYLATAYIQIAPGQSFIMKRVLSSRLSTLELTVGYIVNSVEATISVKVRSGKWLSGCGGVFTVSTASLAHMEIKLLSFGDDGLPIEEGGKQIRLSRCVVGVEVNGKLKFSGKAVLPGGSSENVLEADRVFTPKKSGRSELMLKVGSCEMEVSVAWSLLLTYDR